MTLVARADSVRGQGVWNALNFDGGGSTATAARGQLANVPADAAGGGAVGNALVVVRRGGAR
jgi:exopolysaccharide biosynthesis protein